MNFETYISELNQEILDLIEKEPVEDTKYKPIYPDKLVQEINWIRSEFGLSGARIHKHLLKRDGTSPSISHIYRLFKTRKKLGNHNPLKPINKGNKIVTTMQEDGHEISTFWVKCNSRKLFSIKHRE